MGFLFGLLWALRLGRLLALEPKSCMTSPLRGAASHFLLSEKKVTKESRPLAGGWALRPYGWCWFRGAVCGFDEAADATGAGRGAISDGGVSHSGSMMAKAQVVQASAVTSLGGHGVASSCFRGGRGGPGRGCRRVLSRRSHRAHHETSTAPMTIPSAPVAAAARRAWTSAIMQRHHESNFVCDAAGKQTGSVSSLIEANARTTKPPPAIRSERPAPPARGLLSLVTFFSDKRK